MPVRDRVNQCATAAPASAPTHCAATNPITSVGRMPEKLCVSDRANVTAGLANDVLAVNQYAAKM